MKILKLLISFSHQLSTFESLVNAALNDTAIDVRSSDEKQYWDNELQYNEMAMKIDPNDPTILGRNKNSNFN